ncbi:Similar to COX4I1: Cytochrome c oxidase subunit 4 isoform 1 [Cotesia congregata]|uniref:Mitochondrial (Pongo pygmaeus) n=1 Tax=Cotesia congregata TaxID=51543 RepID=A0A8J2H7F3_COTCN|nr:Similar to COX4I1: Cytochrome c oxidase subunit 4 isoform 1 [Cotesia congregata]
MEPSTVYVRRSRAEAWKGNFGIDLLKLEKEKGDWKKLSLAEKKELYRASFCQTFAELEAPDGHWKAIIGCVCIGISIALWMFMYVKFNVYSPLPESFSKENQAAQLKRIRLLDINPIWGFNKRTPEELAKKDN